MAVSVRFKWIRSTTNHIVFFSRKNVSIPDFWHQHLVSNFSLDFPHFGVKYFFVCLPVLWIWDWKSALAKINLLLVRIENEHGWNRYGNREQIRSANGWRFEREKQIYIARRKWQIKRTKDRTKNKMTDRMKREIEWTKPSFCLLLFTRNERAHTIKWQTWQNDIQEIEF